MVWILLMDKILHHQGWWLSHYLEGFNHPRWCRISSINSMFGFSWNKCPCFFCARAYCASTSRSCDMQWPRNRKVPGQATMMDSKEDPSTNLQTLLPDYMFFLGWCVDFVWTQCIYTYINIYMIYGIYIYQWKDLKTIVDISSPSPLQERFFSQVCDAEELLELTFGKSQPIEMEPPGFVPARNARLINMDQYGSIWINDMLYFVETPWQLTHQCFGLVHIWSDNHKYLLISTWTHHEFRKSCLLESLLKIHRLYGRWSLRGEILRKTHHDSQNFHGFPLKLKIHLGCFFQK